ncbi:MAG: HAD family hydrolase [Candidatus Bathyarchaeia archaeon]|nr:TIGR02253 family HAD-type hydrolase [Candidatus Bathyarchaeota archaeon]
MRVKAVIFDIEDTLYDSSLQMRMARLNAVRAMIEAGLPVDLEAGYRKLEEVVRIYGPNYNRHFDRLLEHLGLRWNPRVIAAGVVAYRETSQAYLKPFPDTIPTLIKLRDQKYKLSVISDGMAVKEWQKLIQLGVHHIFHSVVISEEYGSTELSSEIFLIGLRELNVRAEEALYVSSRPNKAIIHANRAGLTSVRLRRGDHGAEEPETSEAKAAYEIERLSELLDLLKVIEGL